MVNSLRYELFAEFLLWVASSYKNLQTLPGQPKRLLSPKAETNLKEVLFKRN